MALVASILVPITVSASSITVNGENSANNAIQTAINAAPAGATINIAAGTYPEQLTIYKPVTLLGAGPATIIEPTSVSVNTPRYDAGYANL